MTLSIDYTYTSKCRKIEILLQQTRENYINILRLDIKLLEFWKSICNKFLNIMDTEITCDGKNLDKNKEFDGYPKRFKDLLRTSKKNLIKLFLDFLD